MRNRKFLVFNVLLACVLKAFGFSDATMVHGYALNTVPSNAIAAVNYFSNSLAFTTPDHLVLEFNDTTLCLYTDTACTQNALCANPVSPHTEVTTNFDLASTDAYSITFGVVNFNALANQGQGPTHYKCAHINVGYGTTKDTPLALDNPVQYTCELASTGSGGSATFIGGDEGDGNPCGVPKTQFFTPQ